MLSPSLPRQGPTAVPADTHPRPPALPRSADFGRAPAEHTVPLPAPEAAGSPPAPPPRRNPPAAAAARCRPPRGDETPAPPAPAPRPRAPPPLWPPACRLRARPAPGGCRRAGQRRRAAPAPAAAPGPAHWHAAPVAARRRSRIAARWKPAAEPEPIAYS